jgi:hypothetical protein
MSLIANILSKFDDSGIKKATKGFGGLKKTIGAIGIGIGFKAITDQLLEATKAASADQKSMQLLTSQLQKATGATNKQITANEKFLSQLSMQVGIADDDLRPAMAGFARVTGSVSKAQHLLQLALDGSAAKGVPLKTVSNALSRAYAGNTTQLIRMFPELKKSKDIMADYAKIVQGEAVSQADPFSRLNVAMGELQEKLGYIILPYVTEFIDKMMAPGGAIDQVGQFLEDVSDPDTEAGQMFIQVKDAINQTISAVKTFFGYFGDGNATKGFANVASSLVTALPALLALKGIMTLASAGKSIANLTKALGLLFAGSQADPTLVAGGDDGKNKNKTKSKGGGGFLPFVGVKTAIAAGVLMIPSSTMQRPPRDLSNFNPATGGPLSGVPLTPSFIKPKATPTTTNNVTINVNGGDPKTTVNALSTYIRQNGGLPFKLSTAGRKPN